MTIHLDPELERLVQQDIAAGAFTSADEFMRRAVTELHERVRQSEVEAPDSAKDDWSWLRQIWAEGLTLDDDVVQAVNEPVPEQERPELDKFFS